MSFNERYASVYDTLYQDKDYSVECDFLEQIFACYTTAVVNTILDLGCGTGGHVLPLMKRGYKVAGVDRSATMLSEARRKGTPQCELILGDICDINLHYVFDTVIAMFAVISYQTSNENLAAALRTARQHLRPGGLFIFDCWYGPAVLTQRPTDRYKVVERGDKRIIRYTSSSLNAFCHTVRVNYEVLCIEDNRVLSETRESHLMRFLFPKEIEHYLGDAGFNLLRLCPFMEVNRAPTECDWNITVIARAI